MEQRVKRHLEEINNCNQRGGRMLSIRDLLDAGTLNKEVAAYLLAAISTGKSFLVGARPGGVGKTTVMAALLNFIPDVDMVATVNSQVIEDGLRDPDFKCFIAHEIGRGRWYAYIWGKDVANFLKLAKKHMIAGNLHADSITEVLEAEGIDEANITSLHVLVFMTMTRQKGLTKRRINSVYENQGQKGINAFKQVFSWNKEEDGFERLEASKLITATELKRSERTIEYITENDLRTMEEIRPTILKMINQQA